ncbi:ExbD/TolR family protein [Hyphomonas johnsonii]|uniref:Biopolymertransporter ExbD/TolR n=1 Tax=Hyphomonas johnsonii MHS-2 TaxID=1280950 RepID=A0A059FS62_9PROT|nr:biopolymer transporter ExbD [Hyphomonas johnsonii]KCZ93494.1 biopolymertransporter ExbD/TolR [Hyphomonas johnsonii MHS-2]
MKLRAGSDTKRMASIDDRIMPLINIVFLLLIFFLVAGAIREAEPMEVDPPASTAEATSDAAALMIYMSADGRLALGDRVLQGVDLNQALAGALGADPDQPVRIVADKGVEAVKVVEVLEALRAAGSSRVKLTTRLQAAP